MDVVHLMDGTSLSDYIAVRNLKYHKKVLICPCIMKMIAKLINSLGKNNELVYPNHYRLSEDIIVIKDFLKILTKVLISLKKYLTIIICSLSL